MYKLTILYLLVILVGCAKFESNDKQGVPGSQGSIGPQGSPGTKVTAGTFCLDKPGTFPESYIIVGSVIIAEYFDGQGRSELVQLTPGNYVTTDGRNCYFTVTNDYQIVEN